MRIKGIQGAVASFESPGPADQVWRKQLKATLGTVSDAFVDMALHHLERAARMPGDDPSNVSINGALAIIAGFAPKNEMEAAIALQAASTHMVAMVMLAPVGGGHGGPHRPPGLASAAGKLLRAYCTDVETYRRQRGGGGTENHREARHGQRRRPSDWRRNHFARWQINVKINMTRPPPLHASGRDKRGSAIGRTA
jgi:hypothetical protein